MSLCFDAYVTHILQDRTRVVFAVGDGSLRGEDGSAVQAHTGAILCAAPHPSGQGVITGGDDGRLVWTAEGEARQIAGTAGRWIDAVAVAPATGQIAFAVGKTVEVRDVKAGDFSRAFVHERSVAALAFDPKGRRLAAATYGGVALWYGRIEGQKPVMLRWAGSHLAVDFSPDGRFIVTAMQEAALHGWRVSDAMDMQMGGYPGKTRSMAFLEGGAWLATSGAQGVVLWPFVGQGGPMGKQAMEIGADETSQVVQVAAQTAGTRLAAGLSDGRVWVCDLKSERVDMLQAQIGAPISALAVLADGRVAWGDEAGGAGVAMPKTA